MHRPTLYAPSGRRLVSPASLRFDADGELVQCTNATYPTAFENTMTIMCVFRQFVAASSLASRVISKQGNRELLHATNVSVMQVFTARATTTAVATASFANFANYRAMDWMFLAGTIDVNSTANCKLYVGNRSRPPEEPSAYSAQDAGSGAVTLQGSDGFYVGSNGAANRAIDGDLYWVAVFARVLTRAELVRWWRIFFVGDEEPDPVGSMFFMYPGLHTSTAGGGVTPNEGQQVDWSGYGAHGVLLGTATPCPTTAPPMLPIARSARRRKVGKVPAAVTKVPSPLYQQVAVSRASFY